MRRVNELIVAIRERHLTDAFFREFEASIRTHPLKRLYYASYERAFSFLDVASWLNLRTKAVNHFHEQRKGQHKQHLFDQLNDAFAYRWLVRRCFTHVSVLPENQPNKDRLKAPDIEFYSREELCGCEVKTINFSDVQVLRRLDAVPAYIDRSMYRKLSSQFFVKLDREVEEATAQIQARSDYGLVFIVLHEDDIGQTFFDLHKAAIARHLRRHSMPVVIKFGITGQRRIESRASSIGFAAE